MTRHKTWGRKVGEELWGLLVDDGAFALSIVLWLAAAWLGARLGLPSGLACVLFFAGFAGLILHSTLKRAGRP